VTGPMARTPRLRGVVVVAVAAVVAAGSAFIAGAAHSSPALPAVAPDVLVARALRAVAADPSVSGMVAVHVDLGLPDIADLGAETGGAGALIGSLSGDHRVRVWNSPDGVRISDLLPTGERSLIATKTDLWLWDSTTMQAVHAKVPSVAGEGPGRSGALGPLTAGVDPLELAQRALTALDPTTKVFVSGTVSVAGRPAYVLSIEPRTDQTLVGRVDVYVDATGWLPLGGAIYARGAGSPAVSAKYTSVSYGPIASGVFAFTPPRGTKVTRLPSSMSPPGPRMPRGGFPPFECAPAMGGCPAGTGNAQAKLLSGKERRRLAALVERQSPVRVVGSGWTSVVAIRVQSAAALQKALGGAGLDPRSLLPFSGPLFSVRLAQHGGTAWLLAGAVPQSGLERAAAELP